MPYEIKPLACDPTVIKGMSERLIVSHYQNNYGGAVQRLNAITKELSELDFSSAPIFVINGLKREELIAMNSMILHELYFDNLGAIQKGFASAEGKAAAADVQKFATGGVEMFLFDNREV